MSTKSLIQGHKGARGLEGSLAGYRATSAYEESTYQAIIPNRRFA